MKILSYIILLLLTLEQSYAEITTESRADLKDQIIPTTLSDMSLETDKSGLNLVDHIFAFVRDGIFDLLIVFAVGMFLYLGARLLMARGNQEEFKKALLGLVYAGVGIFAVAIAWVAVKFITGLNI